MKKRLPPRRTRKPKPVTADGPARRARAMADLGRRFDDLYRQLDMQLTGMANIQLQFDALRAEIKLL
jgi:hypothetical protein